MRDTLNPLLTRIDRVVVITLADADQRQARIEAMFRDLELPFAFHFGRDCRDLRLEDLIESGDYDPDARRATGRPDLTPGEVGCALSHRDVYLTVQPDESVLILEDDISIVPAALARLADDIQLMPTAWSLAYFGHAIMNMTTPPSVRAKLLAYYPIAHWLGRADKDPQSIRRIYRRRLNARWMHAGWFNETHAYAVRAGAASYLVDLQKRVFLEADVALNYLVRFTRHTVISQREILFEQNRDLPSQIGARPSWK